MEILEGRGASLNHEQTRRISRESARDAGLTQYFTGKPCKHGHVAARQVINAACVACRNLASERSRKKHPDRSEISRRNWYQRERDRLIAYSAEWRVKNAQRVAAQKREYYEKHREATLTNNAKWVAKNPERSKQIKRAWDERNRDTRKIRDRASREKHKEALLHRKREFYKNNKAMYRAWWAEYRAAKLRAMPSWADKTEILAIYREAQRLTRETGNKHEVDHIIPLQGKNVCGLHLAGNLRIVTREINRRKHNKFDTWQTLGGPTGPQS